MNTSNNKVWESLKKWLMRYSRIVLPIILVICVGLTIVIAIHANKRKVEQEEVVVASEENKEEEEVLTVPDVPLEQDAVPGINELFDTYYKAMVEGDAETMEKLVYYLDAREILKAVETSKYIESYPTMEVYTKVGPKEGTYIAFVYAELKFKDYDKAVPGMRVYYVCTNEDGEFYINEDGEEGDDELRYMREIQLQADVIDLNNKAVVAYNDMLDEDARLADFLLALNEEIDKNVGEALAREEENEAAESAGNEEQASAETGEEGSSDVIVTKVKTTDVVNIRTSDSETADKLGKAVVGDEFELLEEKGNGWSKIKYEGREAYIKSQFLEASETKSKTPSDTEQANAGEENNGGGADTASASQEVTGTVTVKENVRIRSGASENSEKLDTAFTGEKLDLIMKQADGWTKIKYNGRTAYVKSEYVE